MLWCRRIQRDGGGPGYVGLWEAGSVVEVTQVCPRVAQRGWWWAEVGARFGGGSGAAEAVGSGSSSDSRLIYFAGSGSRDIGREKVGRGSW